MKQPLAVSDWPRGQQGDWDVRAYPRPPSRGRSSSESQRLREEVCVCHRHVKVAALATAAASSVKWRSVEGIERNRHRHLRAPALQKCRTGRGSLIARSKKLHANYRRLWRMTSGVAHSNRVTLCGITATNAPRPSQGLRSSVGVKARGSLRARPDIVIAPSISTPAVRRGQQGAVHGRRCARRAAKASAAGAPNGDPPEIVDPEPRPRTFIPAYSGRKVAPPPTWEHWRRVPGA